MPILGIWSSAQQRGVLPVDVYESIATSTGNGSASSFTFSSIPSTYQHLQIRLITRGVRSFSSEQLYVRLNGDTGSNYSYHSLIGNGSGTETSGTANSNVMFLTEFPAANETANIFATSVIDILDTNDANKNTTVRSLSGYDNNGNTGNYTSRIWLGSGLWMNTSAVTSVTVLSNGAFANNTTVALYGIKA